VRRLTALITGILGGIAALRWLRRGRRRDAGAPPGPRVEETPDPRAETLRRRLHEARADAADPNEFDAGEVPVDRAEPVPPGPDERRRRVHAEGRAAAEAMRPPDGDAAA
jgi:hypothetical protein